MAPSLVELAGRFGIATDYDDWSGRRVGVPESTLIAVLAALGIPAADEAERNAARAAHERGHWSRALPPTILGQAGTQTTFWVHVTHGQPAEVWVVLEDGSVRTGIRQVDNFTPPFDLDGRWIGEASFVLPDDLPLGYHRVHLRSGEDEASAAVIVTPAWLGVPERLGARRTWGLATQLYSVRSRQSWGVGDLTDLVDLAVWSASVYGAGYVLVNPLHAAEPTSPMEPSPYLPTSRRFVNPLYLRVEAIPEFADLRKRSRVRRLRDGVQKHAAALDSIDRDTAWAAKREALELVFAVPRTAGRDLAFAAYRAREGAALDDFATWCALAEKYGSDWHQWPESVQPSRRLTASPSSSESIRPQWISIAGCNGSLTSNSPPRSRRRSPPGMSLGIMHDLAVGVHPNGADSWALQDALALGVSAGAPPDEFNQLGQDWSQPPWRPDRLEELEYQPFRALIRSVLRHAGGVRIDHIIGLFRLWWIPKGQAPTEGTYVRYDHEAMIGIVALEAYRALALVVGEDLGTVEPWVRDYLRGRGVLGTSILWFELDRDGGGGPLPAERWREYCLSSVTTHDLPPTAGYLANEHVRLRDSLGLLTRPVEQELAAAEAERAAWLAELRRVGLLSKHADVEETVLALHKYLGRTPSRLLGLALTDAVGDQRTQNQPGTTDEYPNWRVPLSGPDGRPVLLEDVFTDHRAIALAEAMRAQTAVSPAETTC